MSTAEMDRCLAVSAQTAKRFAYRFGRMGFQIEDDLKQEAALWIVRLSPRYDPQKASLEAWAYIVTGWGVKDWTRVNKSHWSNCVPLQAEADKVLYPHTLADYLSHDAKRTGRNMIRNRRRRNGICRYCPSKVSADNTLYCEAHRLAHNARRCVLAAEKRP